MRHSRTFGPYLFPDLEVTNNLGPDLFERIVNVASVPQRSPFRYPGGKTWLIPSIRKWLRSLPQVHIEFVEPFAGGGIVSLTVAAERLADDVIMIELDDEVASVWKEALEGDVDWLIERIIGFDLTSESVRVELERTPRNRKQKAFQTLLRNRINHGGILAPGSGLIKNGEKGKGLLSRWYPNTLARRFEAIKEYRKRITFIEGDGFAVMREKRKNKNAVFFIDPPYTAGGKNAGARLYKHYCIDHEMLFDLAKSLEGDFLMTYDNDREVLNLARKYGMATMPIPMKNTHHAEMTELLIGRSLDWAV